MTAEPGPVTASPLDWAVEGAGWPGREHSRFVDAVGLRWHVQHRPQAGAPRLLLLHGTGASTHSWQGLLPLLADRFEWLAVDLPGHAFTSRPPASQLSLPGMAGAVRGLLDVLGWRPDLALGHSAGAAILVRMSLEGSLPGAALAAINGAFLPFGGPAAPLFTPLARLLYAADWVPKVFARRAAQPAVVRRLVEGTGSVLDDAGLAWYGRLMSCPAHAASALGMMAHWDLRDLSKRLTQLGAPLHLLVGAKDRAVSPREARSVLARQPGASLTVLPQAGHLAHEEDPEAVAAWLCSFPSIGSRGGRTPE